MKSVIIAMLGGLSIIIASKWGIPGIIGGVVVIRMLSYAGYRAFRWWEHRQFIKWCAGLIWNYTVASRFEDDPKVLSEAKRIAEGLIDSGNELNVKVHALIHRDNSVKTFSSVEGKVVEILKRVTDKMLIDMPAPPVETFEQYQDRHQLFKRIDKVSRDWELSEMVKDGKISREFYERYVLNQEV